MSDKLLQDLLDVYGKPDLTFSELGELYLPQEERVPGVQELKFAMIRSRLADAKVSEFYQLINWDAYVHAQIYDIMCREKSNVHISDSQMKYIENWFSRLLANTNLSSAVTEKNDNLFSITWDACYILGLWRQFGFSCPESFYLDILSIPASFIVDSQQVEDKCELIEKYVSVEKIKWRITNNLKRNLYHITLRDYFIFCKRYGMPDANKFAIETCVEANRPNHEKWDAMNYLYGIFGSELILTKIMLSADDDLFSVIVDLLYKEKDARLENEIVNRLQVKQNYHLLACLIRMGSQAGLSIYTEHAKQKKCTYGGARDEATEAIGTISDPALLPELIELVKLQSSPDFEDKSFRSLYSCLLEAITSCGKDNYDMVRSELQALKKDAQGNADLINFCSNALLRLERARESGLMRIWSIDKVKEEILLIK